MKTSVEVLTTFIDRENEMKRRSLGEIFEATPERAKYLEILGLIRIVEKSKTNLKTKTEKAD